MVMPWLMMQKTNQLVHSDKELSRQAFANKHEHSLHNLKLGTEQEQVKGCVMVINR